MAEHRPAAAREVERGRVRVEARECVAVRAEVLRQVRLEIPVLDEERQKHLRGLLPPGAGVANPVDMIASASEDHYRKTIKIVAADPRIDALVVIFTPPLVVRAEDVAKAISEEVQQLNRSKPVLAVFLSAGEAPAELHQGEVRVPCYRFPETAAIALSRAARYHEWRNRPEAPPVHFEDVRRDEAAALVSTALARGEDWLNPKETAALFACYGLPLIEQQFAESPEDAGAIAAEMNAAVALKAIAPGVIHKSELGAVKLRLKGREQVTQVAQDMTARLAQNGHGPTGFVVQRMAQPGVEMLVGVVQDAQFGPVIACGAGGVQVELLRDVSVRLTPLSNLDATEMIESLKTYPLLNGFRGAPVCDVAALREGLLRVSALVEDIPQIAELDCNPFVVHEQGAVILDARVRIAAAKPARLFGVR